MNLFFTYNGANCSQNEIMLLTPAKIHLLSEKTINQIAAGEVVENPASVIKELIENSIDAGAREIIVEIQAGGLQLIRIIDNGSGMSQQDLLLSVMRHATSKISDIEDISSICSLGFRGEALASIASISKLSITTAEEGASGNKLEMEGSSSPILTKAARTRGTTIEIRSLFYNVPARRKFQKSPAYCKSEIHRLIQTLALCHTDIRFELKDEMRTIFLSGPPVQDDFFQNLATNITTIYGEELRENCLKIDVAQKGIAIRGFVGNSLETRPNRQSQFLFVNQRPVISMPLSFAVKNGFGQRLASDRFPIFFLHLSLPGKEVDVNVHPQKKEVRFQNEMELKTIVTEKISSLLAGKNTATYFFEEPLPKEKQTFTFQAEQTQRYLSEKFDYQMAQPSLPIEIKREFPLALFGKFLLLRGDSAPKEWQEKSGSLIFINLEEASAQIAYENLLKQQRDPAHIETLLIPITLSLSKSRSAKLEEMIPQFLQSGFEIRTLTPGNFIIETIPVNLSRVDVEPLILTLIDSDEEGKKIAPLSALRIAKVPSTIHEGEKIADALLKCKESLYSFRGKKIVMELSHENLEKLF